MPSTLTRYVLPAVIVITVANSQSAAQSATQTFRVAVVGLVHPHANGGIVLHPAAQLQRSNQRRKERLQPAPGFYITRADKL